MKNVFVIENNCSYIPHNHPSVYPGRPELRMFSYRQIREWLNTFRTELFKFYDIPEGSRTENILINRVNKRRIANNSIYRFMELIPNLKIIYLETLTLREQILALKDARLVISPHGASMYNLVFCKEGTKVIELFPRYTDAVIIHKHYCDVLGHSCVTYIENPELNGFPNEIEFVITADRVIDRLRGL
jgi:capsular polysaccharide biosynthesis protein